MNLFLTKIMNNKNINAIPYWKEIMNYCDYNAYVICIYHWHMADWLADHPAGGKDIAGLSLTIIYEMLIFYHWRKHK